jgi:hypothetical protein
VELLLVCRDWISAAKTGPVIHLGQAKDAGAVRKEVCENSVSCDKETESGNWVGSESPKLGDLAKSEQWSQWTILGCLMLPS